MEKVSQKEKRKKVFKQERLGSLKRKDRENKKKGGEPKKFILLRPCFSTFLLPANQQESKKCRELLQDV